MKSKRWLILCISCLWIASCAKDGARRAAASKKVNALVKEGQYEQALAMLDEAQFQALKAGRFQEDLELSIAITTFAARS